MTTVYLPAFTSLPALSLPSQRSVYVPGARVADDTCGFAEMSVPSLRLRIWSSRYQDFSSFSQRAFSNHSAMVRTGYLSLSSTHTAT